MKKEEAGSVNNLDQKDQLIKQLFLNEVECLICCCIVRRDVATWSCTLCFNIFHLYCVKKWSQSDSKIRNRQLWHCPTCDKEYTDKPNAYLCFCGKNKNPRNHLSVIPHSCGDPCLKYRNQYNPNCKHPCTEICHPGPCPRCQVVVKSFCECGRESQPQQCNNILKSWSCQNVCDKFLSCGIHKCQRVCHSDACGACEQQIEQVCYSHSLPRTINCVDISSGLNLDMYCCISKCGKKFPCGIHGCSKQCHPGMCDEQCPLSPSIIKHCNCGRKTTEELGIYRSFCTDPIPFCNEICGKQLQCGNGEHTCQRKCHDGQCVCELSSIIVCMCRYHVSITIPCSELLEKNIKCTRTCGIRKSCLRHKCHDQCCQLTDHICDLICGKRLACGLHTCALPCHNGSCGSCKIATFEDLSCTCGNTIITAPVPCGTKIPKCFKICSRDHNCDHPVLHQCHQEEFCPPCFFPMTKLCMCEKSNVQNVQCFIEDVSCGQMCRKMLSCGRHFCRKKCHKGECEDDETCEQMCSGIRLECGHLCGLVCHGIEPCPITACGTSIIARCICGRKQQKVLCGIQSESKSDDSEDKQTFDESKAFANTLRFQCDQECERFSKLARLADALKLNEPKPQECTIEQLEYTDKVKKLAFEVGIEFTQNSENRIRNFVEETMRLKQNHNTARFNPAGWRKRQLIHELAVYYGCTTSCEGTNNLRYVVIDAQFGYCRIPYKTLCQTVFPSNFQIPPPVKPITNEPVYQSNQNEMLNDTSSSTDMPRKTFASVAANQFKN